MSAKTYKIINLKDTKKGNIIVAHIDEPYGAGSSPIISIGVNLKGEGDPDWKVHIPYENLNELIEALNEIKNMKF